MFAEDSATFAQCIWREAYTTSAQNWTTLAAAKTAISKQQHQQHLRTLIWGKVAATCWL